MITWVLTICTAGWGMCGAINEYTYRDEASCYRALNEIYKRQGREAFKYIVCRPKEKNNDR